jgi:hypothetical protein
LTPSGRHWNPEGFRISAHRSDDGCRRLRLLRSIRRSRWSRGRSRGRSQCCAESKCGTWNAERRLVLPATLREVRGLTALSDTQGGWVRCDSVSGVAGPDGTVEWSAERSTARSRDPEWREREGVPGERAPARPLWRRRRLVDVPKTPEWLFSLVADELGENGALGRGGSGRLRRPHRRIRGGFGL